MTHCRIAEYVVVLFVRRKAWLAEHGMSVEGLV